MDSSRELAGYCGQDRKQRDGGEPLLASRGVYRPYVVASVGGVATAEALPPDPQHRPRRPLWICQADGAPWPCGTARAQLLEAYCADRDTSHNATLSRQMLWLMGTAAADLGIVRPAKLYQRFVAWTLPRGVRCRVCGSGRHDVLPGLPPRFFPCPDSPEDVIRPIHLPRRR